MSAVFGKILCAVLVVACARGAAGQAAPDVVVLIARGGQASMSFGSLVGVSVGDVNVSYILERKGDRVVLYGAAAGETSLEITQRGAAKRTFKVRVVNDADAARDERGPSHAPAAAAASSHPAGADLEPAAAAPASPLKTTPATTTPSASVESVGSSTPRASGAAAASSKHGEKPAAEHGESLAAAPPTAGKRPGLLSPSRIEVTVETSVSADTETYKPVDAAAVAAQALGTTDAGGVKGQSAAARSEAAATLRANSVEVRRSSFVMPVTVRYEIDRRNSVSVVLPFTRRLDKVKVGDKTVETATRGLGDVQLNFMREFPRLRKTAWEGNVGLSLGLPTARSIYNAKAGKSPLGIGHYELGNVVGVRRVFDPLVFNAALGLSYLLPREVDGKKVKPGLGESLQTGFGYALNDRWVFSEQLYYARRPNYFLNTPTDDRTSSTEQAYLGHSIILNPQKNGGHTVRLSFNLGLTSSSTDYGLGFSYSYRRRRTAEQ